MTDMALELAHEERGALCTAALVTDRVLNDDFVEDSSVGEGNGQRVSDGTLIWVVVVLAELRVLHTGDLGAQFVDAWVGGRFVRAAEDIMLV